VSEDTGSIRVGRKRGYTMIYNDMLVEGMSARAWGVYCYLLSKPEGWEAQIPDLQRVFREGRDALIAVRDELLEIGYLVREEYADEHGLRRFRYLLDADQQHPATVPPKGKRRSAPKTGFQGPGNPAPENPDPENPSLVSKEGPTTDLATTEQQPSPPAPAPDDDEAALQRIATAVYDGTKGAVSYMGARKIASKRIKAGASEPDVLAAFEALWRSSIPINDSTVTQVLTGVLVPDGRGILRRPTSGGYSKQDERDRQIENDRRIAAEIAARMGQPQPSRPAYVVAGELA
jgi:hypothetical protein